MVKNFLSHYAGWRWGELLIIYEGKTGVVLRLVDWVVGAEETRGWLETYWMKSQRRYGRRVALGA